MMGRAPRWLRVAWIVTALPACDNVSWGGAEIALRGPPPPSATLPEALQATQEPPPASTGLGPLLYAGYRLGDSALIVPVGQLEGGGLRPLPSGREAEEITRHLLDERLRPGEELTLFSQGARVGTLIVGGHRQVTSDYCIPRPRVSGRVELIPEAIQAERFLALEKARGRHFPYSPYAPLRSQYEQRAASISLAAEAIALLGAAWPPSVLDIRQDIQVFALAGREGPALAATFLYQDQLRVGPAPDGAYALLVLGEPQDSRFVSTFTWYRRVGEGGKRAPSFFSLLDWNGDGREEILLEVFGADSRWWAALGWRDGEWQVVFEDPCEAGGRLPGASRPLP